MSKVLVNFIQDRSGSMQTVWDETLNGFKIFVNELQAKEKEDGTEYLFSLTTFDTLVETPVLAQPIASVDGEILKKHGPRGGTALYDAVGATLANVDGDRRGAEKIIVVVVTDGQENSSREWTKDRVHAAIDERLKQGDWTFTYLGTQPETWDDARAMGMPMAAAATFTASKGSAMYRAVASSVSRLGASPQKSATSLMTDFMTAAEAKEAGITREKGEEAKSPNDGGAKKARWWRRNTG